MWALSQLHGPENHCPHCQAPGLTFTATSQLKTAPTDHFSGGGFIYQTRLVKFLQIPHFAALGGELLLVGVLGFE